MKVPVRGFTSKRLARSLMISRKILSSARIVLGYMMIKVKKNHSPGKPAFKAAPKPPISHTWPADSCPPPSPPYHPPAPPPSEALSDPPSPKNPNPWSTFKPSKNPPPSVQRLHKTKPSQGSWKNSSRKKSSTSNKDSHLIIHSSFNSVDIFIHFSLYLTSDILFFHLFFCKLFYFL